MTKETRLYNGGKTISSKNGVGKTVQLHVQKWNSSTGNCILFTSYPRINSKWIKGLNVSVCMCSLSQSYLTLWDAMDCSLPGSSVLGIIPVKLLKLVTISSSRGSSWPRIKPVSPVTSALAVKFSTTEPLEKPLDVRPDTTKLSGKHRENTLWHKS